MKKTPGRFSLLSRCVLASLLAAAFATTAASETPAPPALPDRDAELSRRLDALLAAPEPPTAWTVSVDAVREKDGLVSRVRLWSDGVGIWDDESQFRLKPAEQRKVLEAFRDQGFCQINDELSKKGSGVRKSPNALVRHQAITLEIGGVAKTVSHIVSTFGAYPDVEEAAKPLKELARVVRAICEGPAAEGIRAKDLADGLSKIASGKLADVALKVSVNRQNEADGGGWLTRVEARRVATQVSTKGKGWAPTVELRLSSDDFLEFVRTLSVARPGAFPKNIYDEGYTDLTISVLNRSVNVQARPFSGMDPKKHEEVREAYRTVVAAVRKLHEKALLEGRTP